MASATKRNPRGLRCYGVRLFSVFAKLVLLTLSTSALAAGTIAQADSALCSLDRIDETATVASVLDGDTIVLRDGRHVRLIGLNAPEVAHGDKPGQPLGERARDALRAVVPTGSQVRLRHDRERNDKYSRTLAHLATDTYPNLTAHMISQGLAIQWVVPPNDWAAECYARAAHDAEQAQRGIWALPDYKTRAASALGSDVRGYHRVQGTISRVRQYPDAVLIDLDGKLRLRIRAQDMHYFSHIDFLQLNGSRIVARGWIHPARAGLEMPVRHPSAFESPGAEPK